MSVAAADEEPEDALERLLAWARSLSAPPVNDVRQLLRAGIEAGLPPGDMKLLETTIADVLEWSPAVLAAMSRDERNRIDDFGCVSDLEKAAAFVAEQLESDYEQVVWTEGSLHVYAAANGEDADEEGLEPNRFARVPQEELDQLLIDFFQGRPVVRGERDRKEIAARLQARFAHRTFFDGARAGLNVSNGFVAWSVKDNRLKRLRHSPSHKARSLLDVAYDSTATAPTFVQGLEAVLPDASRREAVQEMFGAILFGVVPGKDAVRRIFLLNGAPGSGKSTLIAVLEMLLSGQSMASVPPDSWGREYSRARLVGVTLNVCTELAGDRLLMSNHVKQIASCETVAARHPRGREFEFRPRAWHVFSCNDLPRTNDKTAAFGRRFLAIGFDRSLGQSEVDGDFLERVRAELPGILNWAAEGAARLIENERFTLPGGHDEALLQMQHGDDHVAIFAHARVERAPGARLRSSALQRALAAHAHEHDLDPRDFTGNGTLKKLSRLMKGLYGSARSATNNNPYYEHVRLRVIGDGGDDAGTDAPDTDLADL